MNSSASVMVVVGLVLVLAGIVWLLTVTPPLPMWIVLCGGGLVFVGAGAAMRRQQHH